MNAPWHTLTYDQRDGRKHFVIPAHIAGYLLDPEAAPMAIHRCRAREAHGAFRRGCVLVVATSDTGRELDRADPQEWADVRLSPMAKRWAEASR